MELKETSAEAGRRQTIGRPQREGCSPEERRLLSAFAALLICCAVSLVAHTISHVYLAVNVISNR